jgi:hypothetical protein
MRLTVDITVRARILDLRDDGVPAPNIALRLGVSRGTVSAVLNARTNNQKKGRYPSSPIVVAPYTCKCGYRVNHIPCTICKAMRAQEISMFHC